MASQSAPPIGAPPAGAAAPDGAVEDELATVTAASRPAAPAPGPSALPTTPPPRPAGAGLSRLQLFKSIAPADDEGDAAAPEAPPQPAPVKAPEKAQLCIAATPSAAASAKADGPATPPATPPPSPVNLETTAEPAPGAHAVEGETVTVFDWDDTLLATTVLTRQYCFDVDSTDRLPGWLLTQLAHLESAAIRVLRVAHKCSHRVVLLTNAGDGWVEHSGRRFLPRVIKTVEELNIPIISAQVEYGELFPGQPGEWKKRAFAEQLPGREINLISIGDSNFERLAAQQAGRSKDGHIAHTKTVKFVDSPTLEKLETELHVLSEQLDELCDLQCSGDWDLTLSKAGPRADDQWIARVELCRH